MIFTKNLIIKLAICLFLILGLANPTASQNDVFSVFFIFGFITYAVFNFDKPQVISVFLASLSWIVAAQIKDFQAIWVSATASGIILAFILSQKRVLEKLAIWILIAAFIFSSWSISGELRKMLAYDLPLSTYNNDPGVILKTYQLLEENVDYYEAFKTAQLGRFAQKIIPGDIWGWRLPTIFYIWKFLPGKSGLVIWFAYLAISSLLLFISYEIGKRYLGKNLGLLPSYLIFPYLHFASRDQMFLETEWWSVALFIFGIYFLLTRKLFLVTIFFSLTLLIREVYLLPVGLMAIYSVFWAKRLFLAFLIPISSFIFFFLYHILRVADYIDVKSTLSSPRTVSDGLYFLQQTLAFVSWEYLLFQFRPFPLFVILAVLGCFFMARNGQKKEGLFWLLSFLPFPIAFLRFGTVPYNDYWGVIYVPIAIILAPLSLLAIKRQMKKPTD